MRDRIVRELVSLVLTIIVFLFCLILSVTVSVATGTSLWENFVFIILFVLVMRQIEMSIDRGEK